MTADFEHVLAAGGLVPPDARLDDEGRTRAAAVDTVVARAYRHPVLPGRAVVRLTAAALAVGDDLEMTVLGFATGEDRGAVGKQRRRPLGFPGWALVHDPDNARFALAVVGELKQQARKAKSKPGHAKEGIDAIAVRLGKTVPQFLPSFYEEAGRAFIEHGAPTFAASMFAKAREAEAVHALEVDEQHRVDAFLEFALAGAVTTKALTEYAKQLGDHHEPAVAYAHFRQLCVQRTLGGMPPWSGMAKDLRRLAKAAKLDVAGEDARLVEEIVESPALAKAAVEFWRAYQDAVVALATRAPAVRATLLDLFPTGGSDELDELWLDLLDRTGAVDALVGDAAPAEARSSLGRAAWFDKLCQHLARSWRKGMITPRAFALLRRMAPALVADGKPIACIAKWNTLDLDLAELALELGVAVAPGESPRLDVGVWASHAGEPDHGRDPVRCAADAAVGELLGIAVASAVGNDAFDVASRGKAGFIAAKRRWLDGLLARAETKGVPAVADVLAEIANKVKAETFAELPDLHARLAAIDVAPALARSLRIGVYDELGWPALEDAAAELDPDGKVELTLHGGLPALIVAHATRAIAVSHDRRLGVHDLVVPAKQQLAAIRFIGGQFLVAVKDGWKLGAYWSAAPHDLFECDGNVWWGVAPLAQRACVLGDGAWVEGKRAIRVGDRRWIDGAIAACDGTTTWIAERKDGRHALREVSASGEPGRVSWPAFVEAAAADGWQIDANASYVLPAPDGLTASPLGCADGMLGVRARTRGEPRKPWTARELTRIDGRGYAGPPDARVRELLALPGGELRPILVEAARYRTVPAAVIVDDTGAIAGSKVGAGDRRYWRGSAFALPFGLWHALVARDPAGSRRLRAVTDADARALIGACAGRSFEQLADDVPVAAVAAALPEIAHARLQRGVAGLVALAAQLVVWRDKLRDERAPGVATARPAAPAGPDDEALKVALSGWAEISYGGGSAVAEIARVAAWFASDDRRDRSERIEAGSAIEWAPFAVLPGALAMLARAVAADARRAALEGLHAAIARLPEGPLRVWTGIRTPAAGDEAAGGPGAIVLRWHAGNAYALFRQGWSNTHFHVLEYAPGGTWQPLPRFEVTGERRGRGAVAFGGPVLALDGADRLAELTGMTRSEAVYLLAGCPNLGHGGTNFLARDQRESLGLKAAQAQLARDALALVPNRKRLAALDAAARAGGTVDALAAAWVEHVGKRVAIPEEVIAEADDALRAPMKPSVALAMIGAGDDAPELSRDTCWGLDADGDVIAVAAAAPLVGQAAVTDAVGFGDAALATACAYLPFLYAELPVGDPLRARGVRAYELVLARLAAPTLLLDCGNFHVDDDARAGMDGLLASLGGEVIAGLADRTARSVPGAVITRHEWSYGSPAKTAMQIGIALRPATLDARAAATLGKLVANLSYSHTWGYLEWMRGDDLAAMMKRIVETPVPAGGWEQNPLASAPALVDRVAKRLGVSRDAAALYLQYLVLLWPTPKRVMAWNGWKPKQLDAANAELVAEELVLEAKRERAQRGHFLPGGWEALKSPYPAMETWKLAMYGKRTSEGTVVPNLLDRCFLALAPFHVLYERAWKRVESGDVPKYEDVKR